MCKIVIQSHWTLKRRKIRFKENPLKWFVQLVLRRPMGPEVPMRHFDVRLTDEELMGWTLDGEDDHAEA